MFCPQCGTSLPDQALFCSACGCTLDNAAPGTVICDPASVETVVLDTVPDDTVVLPQALVAVPVGQAVAAEPADPMAFAGDADYAEEPYDAQHAQTMELQAHAAKKTKPVLIGVAVAGALVLGTLLFGAMSGTGSGGRNVFEAVEAFADEGVVFVDFNVEAPDDMEGSTPIPIEIKGKDYTGKEVATKVTYHPKTGPIALRPGNYIARVYSPPVSSTGRLYRYPDKEYRIEIPRSAARTVSLNEPNEADGAVDGQGEIEGALDGEQDSSAGDAALPQESASADSPEVDDAGENAVEHIVVGEDDPLMFEERVDATAEDVEQAQAAIGEAEEEMANNQDVFTEEEGKRINEQVGQVLAPEQSEAEPGLLANDVDGELSLEAEDADAALVDGEPSEGLVGDDVSTEPTEGLVGDGAPTEPTEGADSVNAADEGQSGLGGLGGGSGTQNSLLDNLFGSQENETAPNDGEASVPGAASDDSALLDPVPQQDSAASSSASPASSDTQDASSVSSSAASSAAPPTPAAQESSSSSSPASSAPSSSASSSSTSSSGSSSATSSTAGKDRSRQADKAKLFASYFKIVQAYKNAKGTDSGAKDAEVEGVSLCEKYVLSVGAEDRSYAYRDINGDGIEELLIGSKDGSVYHVVAAKDVNAGEVASVVSAGTKGTPVLFEGGYYLSRPIPDDGEATYWRLEAQTNKSAAVETLVFSDGVATSYTDSTGKTSKCSKEKADEVAKKYRALTGVDWRMVAKFDADADREYLAKRSEAGAAAKQGASSSGNAQSSGSSSAQAADKQEPQDGRIARIIAGMDGWWQPGSVGRRTGYAYIHDGTHETFSLDGSSQKVHRVYQPSDFRRFDNGLPGEFNGGPGYFIASDGGGDYGLYVSDEDLDDNGRIDSIVPIRIDGSGYSGGSTLMRVDPPEWA